MAYEYSFYTGQGGNGGPTVISGADEAELKKNFVQWAIDNRANIGTPGFGGTLQTVSGAAPSLSNDELTAIYAAQTNKATPEQMTLLGTITGTQQNKSLLNTDFLPIEQRPASVLAPSPFEGGKTVDSSGNARPMGYNQQQGAPSANPAYPTVTPISNPVDASSLSGSVPAPQFGTPTGTSAAAMYTGSITQNLDNAKAALIAEADRRAAQYQTDIDKLNQRDTELQQLQDAGMMGLKNTVTAETAEKRKELELEKQRFDENYNANQQLINELDSLLTAGNNAIKNLEATTGLSSIMSPRIAQTMSDVAARAGVIQAVINARNGQMANAQSQLRTTVDVLSNIYGDQIDYYKTLVNYYGSLKDENNRKIVNLTNDQKAYLDVRINVLENELNQIQNTANAVQKAMIDPETALTYARAGVSLKDSVETINQKLAADAYAQEVTNISNTMNTNGYSKTPISGATPVTITDSQGQQHTYYKAPEKADPTNPNQQFTLGTNQIRFDANGNVIAQGPTQAEIEAAKTASPGSELNELLSPSEAKALGVPYGTTKGQAAQSAPKPQPTGYPLTELKRGDTGAAVQQLQTWLVANGHMTAADMQTGVGTYGPKTEAAVLKLQQSLGMDYSSGPGTYGPRTIAAMQGKVYVAPKSGSTTTTAKTDVAWTTLTSAKRTDIAAYISANSGTPSEDLKRAQTDPEFLLYLLGFI